MHEGVWPVSPVGRIMELEEFSGSAIKQFSGNGMHLMTQMSWCLYVFAHINVKPEANFDRMPLPGELIELPDESDSEVDTGREKRPRVV